MKPLFKIIAIVSALVLCACTTTTTTTPLISSTTGLPIKDASGQPVVSTVVTKSTDPNGIAAASAALVAAANAADGVIGAVNSKNTGTVKPVVSTSAVKSTATP